MEHHHCVGDKTSAFTDDRDVPTFKILSLINLTMFLLGFLSLALAQLPLLPPPPRLQHHHPEHPIPQTQPRTFTMPSTRLLTLQTKGPPHQHHRLRLVAL